MQVHPEITAALIAEHERELRTRAEQRRKRSRRDRPRSSAVRPRGYGARIAVSIFGATRPSR